MLYMIIFLRKKQITQNKTSKRDVDKIWPEVICRLIIGISNFPLQNHNMDSNNLFDGQCWYTRISFIRPGTRLWKAEKEIQDSIVKRNKTIYDLPCNETALAWNPSTVPTQKSNLKKQCLEAHHSERMKQDWSACHCTIHWLPLLNFC